jgi:hypothetical protein
VNILDIIQSGRPAVDPMPIARRTAIRESLFGIGHANTTHTIGARSESGAIVSTAPHGTRVPGRGRPRWRWSWVKVAAGLIVVGGLGVVGWRRLSLESTSVATVEPATSSSIPMDTSVAATVVIEPTRTGVSATKPLVIPQTLMSIDDATIGSIGSGAAATILEGPDGSNVWIAEFDGPAADLSDLDFFPLGLIEVATTSKRDALVASYRIAVPCGSIIINDAPGRPANEPLIESLLASISVDAGSVLNATLPSGWSVVDVGDSALGYATQFQLPMFAATVPVRLTQIPDGTIAQLAFGGAQLDPITFLGEPAFVDIAPAVPGLVSIFWKDDDTVFNVSSPQVGIAELESFVDALEPATVDDWSERFTVSAPEAETPIGDCVPQPSFGSTLDP